MTDRKKFMVIIRDPNNGERTDTLWAYNIDDARVVAEKYLHPGDTVSAFFYKAEDGTYAFTR